MLAIPFCFTCMYIHWYNIWALPPWFAPFLVTCVNPPMRRVVAYVESYPMNMKSITLAYS